MARLPLRGPRPVDPRGRLTLPKEVLTELGLEDGGFVEIEVTKGAATIRPVDWRKK